MDLKVPVLDCTKNIKCVKDLVENCPTLQRVKQKYWDNAKQRAGEPCCQMKNMNFPQAGGPLRWAGLHSKMGCGKGWAEGLPFSAACQKFTFFIWKHGPPISVIQMLDSIPL